MTKTIYKLMVIIGLLCFIPCGGFAQSASDSYNKGVALMNKGDYQGAIASFKASMAINKSAANVKKCKAQITKCNRLAKKKTGTADTAKKAPQKTLTVSTNRIVFEAGAEETKSIGIETQPETNDWIANVASEHEGWCKLAKSMDGKELQVTCLPSNSTISRFTGITVIYDQVTQFIQLVQKGRSPQLKAITNLVKLSKRKGGSKQVAVSCNSDTLYSDNKNWQLSKYPEWCEVYVTSGNELTVKADKLTKEHPDFKTGRAGDIILRSQDQEFIIRVEQK